jgi:hypothetical protein
MPLCGIEIMDLGKDRRNELERKRIWWRTCLIKAKKTTKTAGIGAAITRRESCEHEGFQTFSAKSYKKNTRIAESTVVCHV